MNKERQNGSLKFIFDADLVPLNSYCMSLGIIVTIIPRLMLFFIKSQNESFMGNIKPILR